MPCTTILVGKKASYDGSTLMARNEDSAAGRFCPKKFIVVNPDEQPRHYHSVLTNFEMDLPGEPLRYTSMPHATQERGIWSEAGINACNVAMSATETLTANPRLLGADPLVKDGIGEEDMPTVVLPYIRSAREGVLRLGSLIEKYGTCEMNGIGFQDVDEIWWFESVGGHHWMARRVPDDAYAVIPNQQGLDILDFEDALGDGKEFLCSGDLKEFVIRHHLNLAMDEDADWSVFDPRGAFGTHTTKDHVYNTPRAWFMLRYLNPNTCAWDGPDADYRPDSDDLPWCMIPEKKITVEDIKFVLSSYYQGTPFNPYRAHGGEHGKLRPIGINRNNFVAVTQLRSYMPEENMAVEWIAVASNPFNELVPFYTNVNTVPDYLANTTKEVSTDNFYWANRLIGALADAHYPNCIARVEQYQLKLASAGHKWLIESDDGFKAGNDTEKYMAACNQAMADIAKRMTDDLLSDVLYTASMEMKNGFARSDE